MKSLDQQLSHRIDVQWKEVYDVNKRSDKLEATIRTLSSEVVALKETINHLTNRCNTLEGVVDDMDQYSRNANILIHGMVTDNASGAEFESDVLQKLNRTLSTSLQPHDINAIHTLPSHMSQPAASRPKPATIIV